MLHSYDTGKILVLIATWQKMQSKYSKTQLLVAKCLFSLHYALFPEAHCCWVVPLRTYIKPEGFERRGLLKVFHQGTWGDKTTVHSVPWPNPLTKEALSFSIELHSSKGFPAKNILKAMNKFHAYINFHTSTFKCPKY